MIFKPQKPCCPNCKVEGIDNLNMIITLITEQPLSDFKKLPSRISLKRRDAHNGTWAMWHDKGNSIICKNCGYSTTSALKFEKDYQI